MPDKVINARVKQKRDTHSNWQSKNPVLLDGEIILVDMSDGELRAKIGNGTSTYKLLPFSDELLRSLISAVDTKVGKVSELVGDKSVSGQIDSAINSHSHPIDSELSSTSENPVKNKVIFEVTKALIDGLGNKTVAEQITDAKADCITGLSASGRTVTYTKGDGSKGTIKTQDTVYTHPESGVAAGIYKSVSVDANGHVVSGSNPTTLNGYGITDAATKSELNAVSSLVGDTKVSTQISNAIANKSDADHTHTALDVGALPYVSTDVANLNLDEIIKSGEHYKTYRINASTLGTPYKYGVANYAYGIVISTASGVKYGSQYAFLSGANCMFERRLNNGTLEDWHEVYNSGNLPTLSDFGITATADELNYCDGVTSNIQTQLNSKSASSHNHAASHITSGILPIARGGTGSGSGLEDAPHNAIIKRYYKEDSSGNVTNNQLYYTPTKSGAFYATADNGAATFGTLPVAQGGTDATDTINAMKNLVVRATNTVPAEDTPSAWGEMGHCQIYYNGESTVINKPSAYGTLINIPNSAAVHQIFFRQAYGYVWVRSGSSTGWSGSSTVSGADAWRRIYDSNNVIPIENGGTGKTTSLDAANNLKVSSLSEGTQIANGTDLNTITKIGNYRCTNTTDVASLVNCPVDNALFSMKVGHLPNNSTYLYQELKTFYDGRTYYRKKSGTDKEWSDWYVDYNSYSAIPINGGGTGAKTASAARDNLGFTYGSSEPTGTPDTGEGSVYFRTGGDAVVEVGTSGIWTYRKWASGIAECWGKYVCSNVYCGQQFIGGDAHYRSSDYSLGSYPFTFIEVPTQTVSIIQTSSYAYLLGDPYGTSNSVTKTSAGSIFFVRPIKQTADNSGEATVSIQVIGRWK